MLTQYKISLTSGRKPQFVVGGAVSGTLAQAPPDKGLGSNAKRKVRNANEARPSGQP